MQVADIGHTLAPEVTGHSGPDTADFVGTAMTARKIGATLTLDVRRVHPAPAGRRLVWMAISFMTTERPWAPTAARWRRTRRRTAGSRSSAARW